MGAKTGEFLTQQFVVENKASAAGMIAAEMVARSMPDGYTLLNTPISYAVNETLSKTLRAQIGTDFVAVAPQASTANVLVVHPSLRIKTVAELVALAKKNPGKILYGTSGRGASSHLNSELMVDMLPEGVNDIVDLLVPELQRRGLFHREYSHHYLRDALGLEAGTPHAVRNESRELVR